MAFDASADAFLGSQGDVWDTQWDMLMCLIGAVLALVAAGFWGEWVMGRVAESLQLANHWTEWFDPDLVWASGPVLTISLLEYVVFAPIFEELAFRGILYAILRRRLSPMPAAMISADTPLLSSSVRNGVEPSNSTLR